MHFEEFAQTEFLLSSYKKLNPIPVENLKSFRYEKSKSSGVLKGNKYAFLLYFFPRKPERNANVFYAIGILKSGPVVELLPFL